MWGPCALACTEETRKMPFKPLWASWDMATRSVCDLCNKAPKETWIPYRATAGTFPEGAFEY